MSHEPTVMGQAFIRSDGSVETSFVDKSVLEERQVRCVIHTSPISNS